MPPKIVRPEENEWDDLLGPKPNAKPQTPPNKPLQQSDLSTILGQMENSQAANPESPQAPPQSAPLQQPIMSQSIAQYPPQLVIDVTNYVYQILKGKNLPATPAIEAIAAAYSGEENPRAYAHAKTLVDVLGLEAFDVRNEQVEVNQPGSQGQQNAQQGNQTLQQIISNLRKNNHGGIVQVNGYEIVGTGNNAVITDPNGNEIIIHNGQVVLVNGNLNSAGLNITGSNQYACSSEFLTNPIRAGKLRDYVAAIFGPEAAKNSTPWLASAGLDDLLELSALPQIAGIPALGFIAEISGGPVKVERPFHSSYFIVMEMQPTNTRLLAAKALDACYKDGTINVPSMHFYFQTQPYDFSKASSMDSRLTKLKQASEIPTQAMLDHAQKLGVADATPHIRSYERAWDGLINRFSII